jgi:PAS domain S-box-containing protein
MTIGRRIYAGFGLLLVGILVLGVVALFHLGVVENLFSDVRRTSAWLDRVAALDAAIRDVRRLGDDFFVRPTPEAQERTDAALDLLRASAERVAADLDAPDLKADAMTIAAIVEQYRGTFQIAAANLDRRDAAIDESFDVGPLISEALNRLARGGAGRLHGMGGLHDDWAELRFANIRFFAEERPADLARAKALQDALSTNWAALGPDLATLFARYNAALSRVEHANRERDTADAALVTYGRRMTEAAERLVAALRNRQAEAIATADVHNAATRSTTLELVLAIGVAGFIGSRVIGRGITRPIAELSVAMDRLAARDWMTVIPGHDRRDEIGVMARALDAFKENGIAYDVFAAESERMRARAAAMDKERLAILLDKTLVGVITIDEDQRIITYNREAEATFGWTADQMIGQRLDRLLPEEARGLHASHVESFALAADGNRRMGDWRRINGLHKDGRLVPLMAVVSRVSLDDETTFTAIFRDMTSILAHEAALQKALVEKDALLVRADEGSRAKSDFLAAMSHELRTPLNAVIGFSEMMSNEAFGPLGHPKYAEYVGHILGSARHLLSLINDTLDLARIEARNARLNLEPVDCSDVLTKAVAFVSHEATEKGIALAVTRPQNLILFADARATLQILTNLLSNAVKFTERGGEVSVVASVCPIRKMVRFLVKDTGRGIPADMLKHVGRPFFQVTSALVADGKGFGLGLAISRSLAEAMDGTLDIASVEGVGTEVTVVLPVAG